MSLSYVQLNTTTAFVAVN